MKVDNLKDLKKLIQLCRAMGVEAIEVEGIKMNLGPTPVIYKQVKQTKRSSIEEKLDAAVNSNSPTYVPGGITEDIQIPTTGLTDEQLLFYSSQDHLPSEQQ